jgi:hypothetical protein
MRQVRHVARMDEEKNVFDFGWEGGKREL